MIFDFFRKKKKIEEIKIERSFNVGDISKDKKFIYTKNGWESIMMNIKSLKK